MVEKKAAPKALDAYTKSGVLMRGDDARLDITRVSSGLPQLDAILGGGFAYGRNVLCVGPESTGKTVLAQYLVASQQRAENGREECLLVDTEMSYDRDWWKVSGVDTSKLDVAQPYSGEQAIDIIVAAMTSNPKLGVVVLDSIATLSPTAIQEKASGERTVASLANLVTAMYQKIMPINRNTIFFAINQMRANLTGYDDVFPGGMAQRFNSHVRLHTRRVEFIKDSTQKRIGYVMEAYVKKNKVGDPEGECQMSFHYGTQIDLDGSYIDEAIECGIITQAGPWYNWKTAADGEPFKWMGKANMRNHFVDHPEHLEFLQHQLRNR